MSARRLILVGLPWHRPRDPRAPLGHACLLAALHEARVEVVGRTFSLNSSCFDPENVVSWILDAAAGRPANRVDVALGAYVWNERVIQYLLPELRRRGFSGRLIIGGPQISYAGPGLETIYPDVDAFVRGYGESALVELARASLHREIQGVHNAGEPDRELQAAVDLCRLPSPLLSGAVPVGLNEPLVRLETQRGCPFRCNFCQHREAGARLAFRELDRDRVLEEVRLLCRLEVREVAILDPVFNMGSGHHAVLDGFAEGRFSGRLSVQARLEAVNDRFIEQCGGLDVLPEFGLQTIHRDEQTAIDRPNAMRRVDAVLARLGSVEQDYLVTIIYGLPGQTVESFRGTVDHLLRAGVPAIRAFPLVLLRGTDLERRRREWDLDEDDSEIPRVVSSSTFDRADHVHMARIAEALRRTEGRHPQTVTELEAKLSDGRTAA